MSPTNNRDRREPPLLSPQAEELIDLFESLWHQGLRQPLEQYIAACPAGERMKVLVELVHVELEHRLRAGENVEADEYLSRFPELASQAAVAAELTAAVNLARMEAAARSEPGPVPPPTPPVPPGHATVVETVVSGPEPAVPRPPLPRRYDLKYLLGEGGMGDVWLGRDRRLRRSIAVKVVQPRWVKNATILRRFVEEAQLTSQLQHPAIPPVYELGELPDGRPYFCMKVVRGRTLASYLDHRRQPSDDLPKLLGIFEQVCQAVAYAHSKGVIHRDLKPSNVMVGAFGEVQVMDWGLAKLLKGIVPPTTERPAAKGAATVIETDRAEQPEQLTVAGTVLGTLAYMPPEQARGEVEQLDRRCDVFALGALLCEILTGKPPYVGTREEVQAHARIGFTVPALARLESCGADDELTALARWCLNAKVEDRPDDAGCVAAAVADYLAAVQERSRRRELTEARTEKDTGKVATLGALVWHWMEEARRAQRERLLTLLALTLTLVMLLGVMLGAADSWLLGLPLVIVVGAWLETIRRMWRARAVQRDERYYRLADEMVERASSADKDREVPREAGAEPEVDLEKSLERDATSGHQGNEPTEKHEPHP